MARKDNTYSRLVLWLKVILPLLALAGLSTLFLVAHKIDPAQDLPFTDVDMDALTNGQRIGGPTFSGMTASGAAFRLSAARAWPDPDDPGFLTGEVIQATIDLPGGTSVDVRSGGATFANATRTAGLQDGVTVQTTNGYRLTADRLNMTFETLRLWSDTDIVVTGPSLRLEAGQFDITGNGSASEPYVLVFKNKVKLLYGPEQ